MVKSSFVKQVLRDLYPKIANTSYFITISPPTGSEADVKQAVEIGLAILMDKPIIVVVPQGRTIPGKLGRVADYVVEGNMDTQAGLEKLGRQLETLMAETGK